MFNLIAIATVSSFLVGLVTIPFLKRYSEKNAALVDVAQGDALKIHTKPTSLFGGLAMGLAISVGLAFFWDVRVVIIWLGFVVVFGLGFFDDMRWKHVSTIKPLVKFALLLICTLVPAIILSVSGLGFWFVPPGIVSVIVSFIYIFVVINALNYQDGMDGLAGGLAGISFLGFLILASLYSHNVTYVVSMISLGTVISFLVFNFPPASIFMGDAGAYGLGYLLAVVAILFSEPYSIPSVAGPLCILGLPIIDGVFTNIRRLVNGKSIFHGDRSHFYDKLMQRGFSTKKTLAICYSIQVVLVVVGIVMYQ
jgi:UDP-GlcNAc:undecaprenyl-phosphate/decaprenyl-phosphate GlcNAc-1-phosphate transferase